MLYEIIPHFCLRLFRLTYTPFCFTTKKTRKDYREGAEGKTLAFASFTLGRLVATSTVIRGAIAHRSRLFDALVSALRPKIAAGGGGGGVSGGGGGGGGGRNRSVCTRYLRTRA